MRQPVEARRAVSQQASATDAETLTETSRLAAVLAAVSWLVVEVSSAGGQLLWPVAVLLLTVLTGGILLAQQARIARRPQSAGFRTLALVLPILGALAWGLEMVVRTRSGGGLPFELKLMCLMRNTVVALAVLARHRRLQWLGCGLGLFLVVFAATTTVERLAHAGIVIYVIVGSWWLMGRYWDGLQGRLIGRQVQKPSWKWRLSIPLALASLVASVSVAGLFPGGRLAGFVPSSGGDRWHDTTARSGLSDGDLLIAAVREAASFGPVESEIFIDSETPSLYDVFNDTYGEPPKRQNVGKAVALPPSLAHEAEQRMAESADGGREFSVVRDPGNRKEPLEDRAAPALLYVDGRTPLHLRLEVFDVFDGICWQPEPVVRTKPLLAVESVGGKPWVRTASRPGSQFVAFHDVHVLKINRLQTARLPTPWHLLGVHIDRVDRADFFEWTQSSVLGMTLDEIPPGVVVHVQSQPLAAWKLKRDGVAPAMAGRVYRDLGVDQGTERISQLAREVAGHVPHGWRQVEAIVSHLRNEYVHDRELSVPGDTGNAAAEFLLTTRRGPDHLFATSAALLLRSLGYSTRVVSGFYVNPASYDPRRRLTPVVPADVHFWAEVYMGGNAWVEIEPTPGYELLQAPPSLLERASAALASAADWLINRWYAVLVAVTVFVLAHRNRRRLIERFYTLWWHLTPRREIRRRLLQTVTLLERRKEVHQPVRSPGVTPTRWLKQGARDLEPQRQQLLARFLENAEWAAFGLSVAPPGPEPAVREMCRLVERLVPASTWREIRPAESLAAGRSSMRRWTFRFSKPLVVRNRAET